MPKTKLKSRVDKLIRALQNKKVPVVHMCSQIFVEQGRGSLETIMLHHFNVAANDAENSHARWHDSELQGTVSQQYSVNWDDEDALFTAFRAECIAAKAAGLLSVKHADFFATASGSHKEALNDYLLQSRAVFVKLRAADQLSASKSQPSKQPVWSSTNMDRVLAGAIARLAEVEVKVNSIMTAMTKHKACYQYYHSASSQSPFGNKANGGSMIEACQTRTQDAQAVEKRKNQAAQTCVPEHQHNMLLLLAAAEAKSLPDEESKGANRKSGVSSAKASSLGLPCYKH